MKNVVSYSKKSLLFLASLSLAVTLFSSGSMAQTKDSDTIIVIKYADKNDKGTVYSKKFGELKLDSSTVNFIKDKNKELNEKWADNPDFQFRLTHVRVDENKISRIMFLNRVGTVATFELTGKTHCVVGIVGEGGMGGCQTPF